MLVLFGPKWERRKMLYKIFIILIFTPEDVYRTFFPFQLFWLFQLFWPFQLFGFFNYFCFSTFWLFQLFWPFQLFGFFDYFAYSAFGPFHLLQTFQLFGFFNYFGLVVCLAFSTFSPCSYFGLFIFLRASIFCFVQFTYVLIEKIFLCVLIVWSTLLCQQGIRLEGWLDQCDQMAWLFFGHFGNWQKWKIAQRPTINIIK